MQEIAGEIQETRREDGTFLPGVSGNPAGKPKGARHMTTIIMDAIVKVSEGESSPEDVLIVRTLLKKAKNGDMRAIEILMHYVDGKPLQAKDDLGGEDNPIHHVHSVIWG